jgi:hypothetical protein
MICTQDKSESLAHPPPWLKSALSDVARLVALPANWDSYGSPPLSETARQNAVQLLASIEYEGFPAPSNGKVHEVSDNISTERCSKSLSGSDRSPRTETF